MDNLETIWLVCDWLKTTQSGSGIGLEHVFA